MARKFITADYQATLDLEISLREALPADHLAHFIVEVVAELDLRRIYRGYGATGAPPYAPEILLALLFYGYATGVFSSRKIEAATRYSIPFRFIAGNLHPDHDTIATQSKRFLGELKDLFVQILLIAQAMGLLEVGDISIDGTKIHANASKHSAVSYKRLLEIERALQAEVDELFALAAEADAEAVPEAMDIADEIARREASAIPSSLPCNHFVKIAFFCSIETILRSALQERLSVFALGSVSWPRPRWCLSSGRRPVMRRKKPNMIRK